MQIYLRILLIVLFSSLCIFCSLQVAFCLFWSLYFILEASSRCLCSLLVCATGAPHGVVLGEVCWWSAPPYGDLSVPLTRAGQLPREGATTVQSGQGSVGEHEPSWWMHGIREGTPMPGPLSCTVPCSPRSDAPSHLPLVFIGRQEATAWTCRVGKGTLQASSLCQPLPLCPCPSSLWGRPPTVHPARVAEA